MSAVDEKKKKSKFSVCRARKTHFSPENRPFFAHFTLATTAPERGATFRDNFHRKGEVFLRKTALFFLRGRYTAVDRFCGCCTLNRLLRRRRRRRSLKIWLFLFLSADCQGKGWACVRVLRHEGWGLPTGCVGGFVRIVAHSLGENWKWFVNVLNGFVSEEQCPLWYSTTSLVWHSIKFRTKCFTDWTVILCCFLFSVVFWYLIKINNIELWRKVKKGRKLHYIQWKLSWNYLCSKLLALPN